MSATGRGINSPWSIEHEVWSISRFAARALSLGLTVLCLLSLTGCTLPGATRPVVKIGLVAPFEGWYRPRGYDALWAVRLAIQEANCEGGVAGCQVELVALDDHLDPHWAAQRARELVADSAVMGTVGCLSSATVQAARHIYSAAGLPLITPASVEAQGDGVFVLAPTPKALVRAARGHILTVSGQPRVALLYDKGELWTEVARREVDLVADTGLDSEGWLETLLQVHPDWVICTAGARRGGEVLLQARSRGLRALFMGGPEWGTEAFLQIAGDAAQGTWFVTGAPREEDLRDAQNFIAAYRKLGGHEPGPDAVLTYDATRVLLAALEEAIQKEGQPTRQGVREALLRVSLPGLTGPLAFDHRGARVEAPIWAYASVPSAGAARSRSAMKESIINWPAW